VGLCSVALAVLLAACDATGDEFAVGTLERDRIEVAADSGEPIGAIQVREGDPVAVGDLLLQQDSVRLDAQLRAAEAERALAVARLQEAENGPLVDSIERARALLAEAAAGVRTAEAQLARARSLRARDYASAESLDVLQGSYDAARARQAQARELLAELEAGTRWEILAQLRATVAAVEARIDELRVLLDRARVRAPVAGVVEALPFEPGERPQPGQTVVVLRAAGPTYARVHLPEALRARLAVADAALVRLDGHAGEYRGRVRWIAGEAAFTPYYALTQHDRGRLSYLAEVELEPGDAVLPAGVPVEVRFPARP
jgi:HlyD family secretion protein